MNDAPKIPPDLPPEEVTTFGQAATMVQSIEATLAKYGIQIAKNTDPEKQCLAILHWEDRRTGKIPYDPYDDPREELRAGIGALHLFRLLLDADGAVGLSSLVKHLKLLNEDNAIISQNTNAPFSDATNKLFELFLGAVCLTFATDVVLDDPNSAKGTNPDVLFTFRGKRWGLACKVLGGSSPLTLYERVEDGIRQIENSPAQSGFVVVNMRNQIDHDAMWPLQKAGDRKLGVEPTWGVWRSHEDATAELLRRSCAKFRSFLDENGEEAIKKLIANSRAQPAILLFIQTTVTVRRDGRPVPTRLGLFHRWDLGPVSAESDECLIALNNALHHRS